jgi:hypothetical protein
MATFESIVLEKEFQEDQARGGSGILASGGLTDCADAAIKPDRKTIHKVERDLVNVFKKKQVITLLICRGCPSIQGIVIDCTAQTTQTGPNSFKRQRFLVGG